MDDLTGPCSVPSEIVILRVGFGEDEAVDAIAVRELTLAAVAVASPDRWLFVEADAWLTEFAWEAAAHIGTRRHMRFIDAVNGVPPGVRITGAQASGNSRRIVAALTGGSPPPTKIQVSRVLPFGSTGGRAAREVSLIKETEDVRRILANDIVYAPRISQLLGPGGFESPFSPPTPLASPSLLLADYPSAFSSIDAHNANALAQSLERVDSKQPRRSTASRAEQAVQSLIGTPPLLIVVFGSAASGTDVPRDVDILVLVSEGNKHRRLAGYGFDVTVLPVDRWRSALASGDLFAWSVSRGRTWNEAHNRRLVRIIHVVPQLLDERPKPLVDVREAIRYQCDIARQVGWLLVRPESRRVKPEVWSSRARWAVRTLCVGVAAWHGVADTNVRRLVGWLGGAATLLLLRGESSICTREAGQQALRECLEGLGSPPTWFKDERLPSAKDAQWYPHTVSVLKSVEAS